MLHVYVIGCGGLGGYLTYSPTADADTSAGLSRQDACSMLFPPVMTLLQMAAMQSMELLEMDERRFMEAGCPSLIDRLTLIDGDAFEGKNLLRQAGCTGSKVERTVELVDNLPIRRILLPSMQLEGINAYINPGNISEIIPRNPEPNPENLAAATALHSRLQGRGINPDTTVVFFCVDNHKTRYEVSKYLETFDYCLIINGGNTKDTGNVTVHERWNGIAIDPTLYEMYPEVAEGHDRRPDEIHCDEVVASNLQTALTNSYVSLGMLSAFYTWLKDELTTVKKRKGKEDVYLRNNQILITAGSMPTVMAIQGSYNKNSDKGVKNA